MNEEALYIIKVIQSCQYVEQLEGTETMIETFKKVHGEGSLIEFLQFLGRQQQKKVEVCSTM
jgi:hypothetical protein